MVTKVVASGPSRALKLGMSKFSPCLGQAKNLAAFMLNIPQMAPCCGKCPETLPKQLRRRPQCRGQRGQKYCACSLWRLPCPCADIRHRDNFSLAAFGRAFSVNHLGMVEGTSRLASRFQSRGSTVYAIPAALDSVPRHSNHPQ